MMRTRLHDGGTLVTGGLGVGDGLGGGEGEDGGFDPGSTGSRGGWLVAVSAGVLGGGCGVGEPEVGLGDVVGDADGDGEGEGGFEGATGGGAVVIDGGAGEEDGVGVGIGANAATCAATAGPAAASWGSEGTVERPPLPLVPGGTGPGADGVGTTPVRYARAHCSTMST